jgi:hypothetical protein
MFPSKHPNVFFLDEAAKSMVYVFPEPVSRSFGVFSNSSDAFAHTAGKKRKKTTFERRDWPPRLFWEKELEDEPSRESFEDDDVRPVYSIKSGVEGHFWLRYGEVRDLFLHSSFFRHFFLTTQVEVTSPILERGEKLVDTDGFREKRTLALAAALRRRESSSAFAHPLREAVEQRFETFLPSWKYSFDEWTKHGKTHYDRFRCKRVAIFEDGSEKRLHDMVLRADIESLRFKTFRQLFEEDAVWFEHKKQEHRWR